MHHRGVIVVLSLGVLSVTARFVIAAMTNKARIVVVRAILRFSASSHASYRESFNRLSNTRSSRVPTFSRMEAIEDSRQLASPFASAFLAISLQRPSVVAGWHSYDQAAGDIR